LANRLKIKHNSLKPHLDKLRFLDLVFTYKNSDDKVMLGVGMENIKELSEFEFGDKKEYEKSVKEAEHQQALVKYLEKIKSYLYDKEMNKLIEFDLRKKKDLPKKINYKRELSRLKRNEKIADEVIKERENDTNAPKPKTSKHKERIKK
jgi:hypothetical protein